MGRWVGWQAGGGGGGRTRGQGLEEGGDVGRTAEEGELDVRLEREEDEDVNRSEEAGEGCTRQVAVSVAEAGRVG